MLVAMFVAFISCSNVSAWELDRNNANKVIEYNVQGTTSIPINGPSDKKIKYIAIDVNRSKGTYDVQLQYGGKHASETISTFDRSGYVYFINQNMSCPSDRMSCVKVSYAMPGTNYDYISQNASQTSIVFNKKNWIGSLELSVKIYVYYL